MSIWLALAFVSRKHSVHRDSRFVHWISCGNDRTDVEAVLQKYRDAAALRCTYFANDRGEAAVGVAIVACAFAVFVFDVRMTHAARMTVSKSVARFHRRRSKTSGRRAKSRSPASHDSRNLTTSSPVAGQDVRSLTSVDKIMNDVFWSARSPASTKLVSGNDQLIAAAGSVVVPT